MIKSQKNKRKISHLIYKNNNINRNQLKYNLTLFEKSNENIDKIWKEKIEANLLYYFCLRIFTKDKEKIQLFN